MSAVTITLAENGTRRCGDCTLCCKLIPVTSLGKSAGERCQNQRMSGCRIYASRPMECRFWNCRWLVNDDTADLSRPDRAHYVIDVMPDFVTAVPNDGGAPVNVPVVQVWVDPKHPDAHRDPALRQFLLRRGAEGVAAIIRYDDKDGFVLAPPNMSGDGEWREIRSAMRETTHSVADIWAALGGKP